MEQLVLILIIALISFVNWLMKKAGEARERKKRERQQQMGREPEVWQDAPPPAAPPAEAPDESMRRLMEALGLPMEAEPPPVPERRPPPAEAAPPVPPVPPIPVPVSRPVLPPPLPAPPRPKAASAKTWEKPGAAAKVPLPAARPFPSERDAARLPASSLRALLASPDSLKKAIVLTEILGAPKALRS